MGVESSSDVDEEAYSRIWLRVHAFADPPFQTWLAGHLRIPGLVSHRTSSTGPVILFYPLAAPERHAPPPSPSLSLKP